MKLCTICGLLCLLQLLYGVTVYPIITKNDSLLSHTTHNKSNYNQHHDITSSADYFKRYASRHTL